MQWTAFLRRSHISSAPARLDETVSAVREFAHPLIGGLSVPRRSPRTIIERAAELEEVFHLETGRVIGNDWVVRHDNRYFQVKAQVRQYAPAKGKVTVCEWDDGRLQIRYRSRAVVWEEIPGPVPVQAVRPREATAKRQKPPTPKADHPWRQDYRKMCPWSKPGAPPGSLIQAMSG